MLKNFSIRGTLIQTVKLSIFDFFSQKDFSNICNENVMIIMFV